MSGGCEMVAAGALRCVTGLAGLSSWLSACGLEDCGDAPWASRTEVAWTCVAYLRCKGKQSHQRQGETTWEKRGAVVQWWTVCMAGDKVDLQGIRNETREERV